MGICQMSLLQISFDKYSALIKNKLLFKYGQIWQYLQVAQPAVFDRTGNWVSTLVEPIIDGANTNHTTPKNKFYFIQSTPYVKKRL